MEILIATPLKLSQLAEKYPMLIQNLQFMVLDEADKMFEMGF
jgi:superfamily II DNA/RNA helicase